MRERSNERKKLKKKKINNMPKKPKRISNIKIVKSEENPETPEVLAASLIKISESLEALRSTGGLNDDAIAALVANMRGSKVTKTEVLLVMDGLSRLKSYYIRK